MSGNAVAVVVMVVLGIAAAVSEMRRQAGTELPKTRDTLRALNTSWWGPDVGRAPRSSTRVVVHYDGCGSDCCPPGMPGGVPGRRVRRGWLVSGLRCPAPTGAGGYAACVRGGLLSRFVGRRR